MQQLPSDGIAAIGGKGIDVLFQPGTQRQVAYAGGLVPQAAGRELGHGDEGCDEQLAQDAAWWAGPAVFKSLYELGHGAGPLVGHDRAAGGGDLVHVDAGQFAPVGSQYSPAQHGVVAGPPGERVAGGDEVDGAPHQVGADHHATGQRSVELPGFEIGQAGPQPGEGFLRILRLQAAQMGHCLRHGAVAAREQVLAGEGGAVEGTGVEDSHGILTRRLARGTGVGAVPCG